MARPFRSDRFPLPAGEGGPGESRGRERGYAGPAGAPSDAIPLTPTLSPWERGLGGAQRPDRLEVGPSLTSLGGCSVLDGTGWSRTALRAAAPRPPSGRSLSNPTRPAIVSP